MRRDRTWPAYAAAAWAFIFAIPSFYWALGGTAGASTVFPDFRDRVDNPAFLALLWITAIAKVAGGLFALLLARHWKPHIPRSVLLIGGWAAGIGMALYGGLGFILDGLRVAGLIEVAAGSAARWHFLLWDPWWFLGGVLFILAAAGAHSRGQDDPDHMDITGPSRVLKKTD